MARRGRLKLVVTDTSDWQQAYLDCWTTRDELIDACMASAHVPFFLDLRLAATYRCRPVRCFCRRTCAFPVITTRVLAPGIALHGGWLHALALAGCHPFPR